MSTKVRQYLYTAEDIYGKDALDEGMSRDEIWHAYEAALAEDAELIQRLVDDLRLLRIEFGNRVGQTTQIGIASLSDAEDAGFKPTDQ